MVSVRHKAPYAVAGWIGLRQMQWTEAAYRDFCVYAVD